MILDFSAKKAQIDDHKFRLAEAAENTPYTYFDLYNEYKRMNRRTMFDRNQCCRITIQKARNGEIYNDKQNSAPPVLM